MMSSSKQSGYTLIELLLYVSIVGTVLTAVVVFYGLMASARVKNQSIAEVDQQATFAMDYITQTVRNATSVTSPAQGTSGSSLTVTVPTAANSPTVINLASSAVQTKEGSAAAIALTGSKVQITNFTVKNLGRVGTDGVVQVSFTVSRVNSSGRNEYDYQKTFVASAALR